MVSYFNLQSFDSSEPKLFLHISVILTFLLCFAIFLLRNTEYKICVTFVVSRHEILHLVVWKGVEGVLN